MGRERGTGEAETRGSWDLETLGLGDLGREDVGTRRRAGTRRDKQTTPDLYAEFVKYNFRWLIVR